LDLMILEVFSNLNDSMITDCRVVGHRGALWAWKEIQSRSDRGTGWQGWEFQADRGCSPNSLYGELFS